MYIIHVTSKNFKEINNGYVYQAYLGLKLRDIPIVLKDIFNGYRLKFKLQLTNFRTSYESKGKLVKSNLGG